MDNDDHETWRIVDALSSLDKVVVESDRRDDSAERADHPDGSVNLNRNILTNVVR